MPSNARSADLTTILARLKARNEQLDRTLEAALQRGRHARPTLAQLAELRSAYPPARVAAIEQRLAAELRDDATRLWEEMCRPSLNAVSRDGRAKLWRA